MRAHFLEQILNELEMYFCHLPLLLLWNLGFTNGSFCNTNSGTWKFYSRICNLTETFWIALESSVAHNKPAFCRASPASDRSCSKLLGAKRRGELVLLGIAKHHMKTLQNTSCCVDSFITQLKGPLPETECFRIQGHYGWSRKIHFPIQRGKLMLLWSKRETTRKEWPVQNS